MASPALAQDGPGAARYRELDLLLAAPAEMCSLPGDGQERAAAVPGLSGAAEPAEVAPAAGTSSDVPAAVHEQLASPPPRAGLWPLGVGLLALALSLVALGRRGPSRKELERRIDTALKRRLQERPSSSPQGLKDPFGEARRRLENRAAELHSDLEAHARSLCRELWPEKVAEVPAAVTPADFGALQRELEDLGEAERCGITDTLEAMSQLGYWIELLWPVLQEAPPEGARGAIPEALPEPAGEEWRRARATLEDFAIRDAALARALLCALARENGAAPPEPAEVDLVESFGLLDGELGIKERLKRYLEPFDHPGRLGEVTLALQYLVEAYPIEQLESRRRGELRRSLAEALRSVRLEDDFHRLIARIAAGVGLDYRPVPYYKSRLDQSDYAFVREQVSPISLTDQVGFAAATDPSVIVRLERPFFFHHITHVYYAGHAHVARG